MTSLSITQTDVEVVGVQEFLGKEIPVIEGGFGKGQKVVLAKTVAEIHNYENGEKSINLLINRNIKRFNNDDLINLCIDTFKVSARNLGFITSNVQKHCYLLSQRGYTKLVAMMDNSNDKKWDVMNNLIGDYFNMKAERNNKEYQYEELSIEMKALLMHDKKIQKVQKEVSEVKEDLQEFKDDIPLFTAECKEIVSAVRRIGTRALGGKGTKAYNNKSLRAKVYADIHRQLKREFDVNSYTAIKRKHLKNALDIVEKYSLTIALNEQINMLNNQVAFA